MQSIIIEASNRKETGKLPSIKLKKNGLIPAILYGDGINCPISLNEKKFLKVFNTIGEHTIVNLDIEGAKYDALIHDYQEHPVTRKIIHVDFYKVNPNKKVKTYIPVHSKGIAQGVKMGGILEQYVHLLHIECLPKYIPHEIVVDVSELNIKQGIYVRDLKLDENIKILTSKDQAIFIVHITRAAVDATEGVGVETQTEVQTQTEKKE